MQGMPLEEDDEREDASEAEEEFAVKLAGLMRITTNAQYQMYSYFDQVPADSKAIVYQLAMRKLSESDPVHEGSRSIH
jgi:hypothetical protein